MGRHQQGAQSRLPSEPDQSLPTTQHSLVVHIPNHHICHLRPVRPPLSQRFAISPKCKTFAPGNLRATADNPAYKALVSYWVDQQYTLRYR